MAHYTDYHSFSEAFIAFGSFGRAHGLNIGINENTESLITAEMLWGEEDYMKYAIRSLYCKSPDEFESFDIIYDRFWERKKLTVKSKVTYKNQTNLTKPSKASLVMLGEGESNEDEQNEARSTSGANAKESFRKTDFAKVQDINSEQLEQLADELWNQMNLRLKRRLKMGKKGHIDLQKTIRKNISKGGTFIDLIKKKKDVQKFRLLVLLDVSGSMDKYSFYLLRFIYSLRSNFENVEAFIFSTRLIKITEYLDAKNIRESLAILRHQADNWSSGTKIGSCLKDFNERYAKRMLNGRTMTLILSDGLETGDPTLLEDELKKIKLRSKKMVWLNPLKGMDGYEPIQRGMKVAMPNIDHFSSAHNIESLLSLEKILINA